MNAKAQRAEYKRRRTVAIKKLREAGMSEAEIQQELLQVREELGLNQASNDETEDSAGGDPSTGSAIDGGVNGLDRLPAVISRDHESQSKAKQSAFVQWSEEWWAHSKPEVRHRRCRSSPGTWCTTSSCDFSR